MRPSPIFRQSGREKALGSKLGEKGDIIIWVLNYTNLPALMAEPPPTFVIEYLLQGLCDIDACVTACI